VTDEVGFPQPKLPSLDAEHREVYTLLQIAVDEGVDALSQWEADFAKSCLRGLTLMGNKWDVTPNRQDVLNRIQEKLEREGFL
jgi:predicted GTPase